MRQCGECKEQIQDGANTCPHCHSRLDRPYILNWMLLGIVGIAIILWVQTEEGMNALASFGS